MISRFLDQQVVAVLIALETQAVAIWHLASGVPSQVERSCVLNQDASHRCALLFHSGEVGAPQLLSCCIYSHGARGPQDACWRAWGPIRVPRRGGAHIHGVKLLGRAGQLRLSTATLEDGPASIQSRR